VAVAERGQGALVTVLDAPDEDRIGKAFVDERGICPSLTEDSTASARGWLHGPVL